MPTPDTTPSEGEPPTPRRIADGIMDTLPSWKGENYHWRISYSGREFRDRIEAAIANQRAEIERLRSENATLTDALGRSKALHAEFDAEIERLRAGVDRARKILSTAFDNYGEIPRWAREALAELEALSGKGES